MDIYSAESYVNKLLKYVQDVADTKPRMYEKSRERLKDLAITCDQVIKTISEILQEEILQDDDSEFAGVPSDIHSVLNSMQVQISQLQKFTNYSEDAAPSISSTSESDKLSVTTKRTIISEYHSTFSLMLDNCKNISTCEQLHVLVKLLHDWFDTRFIDTVSGSSFRYNIRRISGWLCDIVILYGHAIHIGQDVEFISRFYNWLNLIETTDARNRYAVPYEVYQIDKKLDPAYLNLESVVLWDMLLDSGLQRLCDYHRSYYPAEDAIYTLCVQYEPELLDDYVYYNDHREILTKLRWEG